jgi:Arc/MetJ family transcription regulator
MPPVRQYLDRYNFVRYNVYANVCKLSERMIAVRTNIVLDDVLISKALALSNLKSKKDVVNAALAEYVTLRERRDLSNLRGKIQFADGYDHKAAREGRFS